jgi:hypothetical protein
MNRLRTLADESAALRGFATELRRRARALGIVHVRLTPGHDQGNRPYARIEAWAADFRPVPLTLRQAQSVAEALIDRRPDINWYRPHQYSLGTGMWTSAPEPHEAGFIPEIDRHYGGGPVAFALAPLKRRAQAQEETTDAA